MEVPLLKITSECSGEASSNDLVMLNVSSAEGANHLRGFGDISCDLGIEFCVPVWPQGGAKPWQIDHILAKNRDWWRFEASPGSWKKMFFFIWDVYYKKCRFFGRIQWLFSNFPFTVGTNFCSNKTRVFRMLKGEYRPSPGLWMKKGN